MEGLNCEQFSQVIRSFTKPQIIEMRKMLELKKQGYKIQLGNEDDPNSIEDYLETDTEFELITLIVEAFENQLGWK